MTKKIALFCVALMASCPVFAADRLERMESLSEELSQLMFKAMIDRFAAEGADVTKLRSLVPDTEWTPPMREAAGCVLGKYQEKIGVEGLDKLLTKMDAVMPALREGGMQAFEEMGNITPEGVSDTDAMEINEACGMANLMQEQMMSGGFMQEAMKLMQNN